MARPNLGGRRTTSPGDGPPAAGAPWDLPLDEAPLAFVDLEMTGLALETDRVIEICIERVRGGVIEDRLESLVNPGVHGNAAIHGISAESLAGAPSFADLAPRVMVLLEGAVLIAHAAEWDLAFLEMELARIGLCAPSHALDSLVLARRAFHQPTYALSALATALGIEVRGAHRAGEDVRVLRGVFGAIQKELSPKTARDLFMVRIGENVPRPEVVAACTEAASSGAPVRVTYRPASSGPQELDMVLTLVDGLHAYGFLLPGRGRRTLLLSRVLRVTRP